MFFSLALKDDRVCAVSKVYIISKCICDSGGMYPTQKHYFWYPFHSRVTAVARETSWSFCQKMLVAGYSTLHRRLLMKYVDTVNWCMVVRCTQNVRLDSSFLVAPAT